MYGNYERKMKLYTKNTKQEIRIVPESLICTTVVSTLNFANLLYLGISDDFLLIAQEKIDFLFRKTVVKSLTNRRKKKEEES